MGDGPYRTPLFSGAPTISVTTPTDEEADPYNASKGFWHSHVGWLFINTPYREDRFRRQITYRPDDSLATPVLLGDRRLGPVVALRGRVSERRTDERPRLFLTAGVLRTVLVLNSTLTINSSHMVGTQPHGTQDSSRDSWLISFISFGEGYHNYHHTYSHDYRNGSKWYNFDPSKWLIIYALAGRADV